MPMKRLAEPDTTSDFTSQISDKLRVRSPIRTGSFGEVYRCTIESSEGEMEAAVKVLRIDPGRDMEKIQNGILRELKVWSRLKHSTIVPLLGTAQVEPSSLALVSRWMSSGSLYEYLEKQTTTIPPSARVGLAGGIGEGLNYLHTKNVIHGDLHPGNVLIDGSGNPCLADFGLATVAGDPELQWTTLTMERIFHSRWRAPEVIGIKNDPERPTFKSDIYSFGGVMFFIISGDIPWKDKKQSHQICIELSQGVTPARPENIHDNHWDLIQECWSWDPRNRPGSTEVLEDIIHGGTIVRKGTRGILQKYQGRPGNTVTDEESEGRKLFADRRTTPVIQGSRDTPGPLAMMSTYAQVECRSRPRNIVLYGECGIGKSSLINLLTRDVVDTSHPPYDAMINRQCFRLWDTTAGLNERSRSAVPAAVAERNLTAFLRDLNKEDGVHLVIYCVRGTRGIGAPQTIYKTFSSVIGDSNVPTVVVLTCVEECRPLMAEWWNKKKDRLAEDGMNFSGYACVTTLRSGREDSLDVRRSYDDVCGLILDHCSDTPHKTWGTDIKDRRNFVQKLTCLS